jgi:catechol 2,3-dioxygenase-like lactoylglutathione lyase family enzyme
MGFVGIEEISLKVEDLDRAIDFYHNRLGIPLQSSGTRLIQHTGQ